MSITKEKALQLYEKMCTIREFEELVKKEYLAGNLPGFVHLYIGEEAVASGICGALEECDYIESTHRGHGHCIAKGADLNRMMAEIYGKKTHDVYCLRLPEFGNGAGTNSRFWCSYLF